MSIKAGTLFSFDVDGLGTGLGQVTRVDGKTLSIVVFSELIENGALSNKVGNLTPVIAGKTIPTFFKLGRWKALSIDAVKFSADGPTIVHTPDGTVLRDAEGNHVRIATEIETLTLNYDTQVSPIAFSNALKEYKSGEMEPGSRYYDMAI